MPRRPKDPPVTLALIPAFLASHGWMASSRKPRERIAYLLVEKQAERIGLLEMELATLRGEESPRSWAGRVAK